MRRVLIPVFILAAGLVPRDLPAGAWTLPRGQFWSKLTLMSQATDEEYVSVGGQGRPPDPDILYGPGDRARYRFNGEYSSRAVFLDIFYGLTDRFDVGVQVPFYRQEFVDDALLTGFGEPRTATGFSDIRGFLKFRVFQGPAVGALKIGFKAPTGDFVNQDGLIPVGEGQWDFDFIFQLGRSFWPLPAYANIDVGYRLRLKNDQIDRDPGDEWFFLGEVGYTPHRLLLLAAKLEGIRGRSAVVLGFRNASDVKSITYLSPTVSVGPFRNVRLEAALRISLSGRNFPAGRMLALGVSYAGSPFRKG